LNREATIFGVFDGMTSVVGVIAALAAHAPALVAGAIGLAIASALGMGAGEYLSDGDGSLSAAVAIALATLVGTITPVIPFILFYGVLAISLSATLLVILGIIIAHLRPENTWPKAYAQTFGLLLAAAAATWLVAALTGAS
jgi:VIT1/CCC1 family predicted Fe2+/Mn2+ transporter